jgi:poly(3-hydroxybutyrate) depolymerase
MKLWRSAWGASLAIALASLLECSGTSNTSSSGSSNRGASSGNTGSSGGSGLASSGSTGGSSGVASAGGSGSTTSGETESSSGAGLGATTGTGGGLSDSSTGTDSSDAAGLDAEAGGMTGDTGMASGPFPSGRSAGCNMPPPTSVVSGSNKLQTISVPSCGAGAVTPSCVAPAFSPGGADYLKVQQWDFNNRNYGLELPSNYDPTMPYPVILEGGGCTAGPTTIGGGFNAGEGSSAIRVGLSYVGSCFADGGVGGNNGSGCAIDEAHIADCDNTPEVPYVNAVLDYVEAHLCVDLGKIYIGGLSSGAWEASTLSCALADRIRGMTTVAGGLRINRPACTGPTAAFMIVDSADSDNPIGPMMENQADPSAGLSASQVSSTITFLDSYGSAPMRDELLQRNGCQGTATAMDPAYPACVLYTGCPAAYPVEWCLMPGEGHGGSFYQNVNYGPGAWKFFSKLSSP